MKRVLIVLLFVAGNVFAQGTETLESELQKHPDHLSTRLQLANVYFRQNNLDKVITLLNAYTDQLTSSGFLTLAEAYSNKKNYTDEVRVLNLLVAKQDEDFHWHLLLGQAYLKAAAAASLSETKRDHSTAAIQQFRRALGLNPKYKPAYDILLTTLLQQKAHNEAREVLMEGLNHFGKRPEIYGELCRLDSNDGFLDQAIENCRTAIKLAPGYPDNYVFLIQAFYDQKESQTAESDAISAAQKFPKSEFVQWATATLFFKLKNYPVAARYYLAATAADPKSGRAQFGLAQAQFESGDHKAALEHFIKACEADASTVDTFLASGGKLKQTSESKLGEEFVARANSCRK